MSRAVMLSAFHTSGSQSPKNDREELTLSIVLCSRHGRYNVTRLMEQNRDAKLTDLLQTLANCLIRDGVNAWELARKREVLTEV